MVVETDYIILKIVDEVVLNMKKYIQWNDNDCEAGGILVGWENRENGNIVIDKLTVPMKKDVRTRTRFLRCDRGHLEYFRDLYDNSKGIYAYYGEWHTHPEDIPHYSLIDLKNWSKIAKGDLKNIQFHIIVGRKMLSIWKMESGQKLPKLAGKVELNEKML